MSSPFPAAEFRDPFRQAHPVPRATTTWLPFVCTKLFFSYMVFRIYVDILFDSNIPFISLYSISNQQKKQINKQNLGLEIQLMEIYHYLKFIYQEFHLIKLEKMKRKYFHNWKYHIKQNSKVCCTPLAHLCRSLFRDLVSPMTCPGPLPRIGNIQLCSGGIPLGHLILIVFCHPLVWASFLSSRSCFLPFVSFVLAYSLFFPQLPVIFSEFKEFKNQQET